MQFFQKSALAPAKINFFLRITGVRADGYHYLSTLMHKIDLSDEITLSIKKPRNTKSDVSSRMSLSLSGYPISSTGQNTVQRAVELFWSYIDNNEDCARIHVKKRIPDQAGLGGGSSDAATALMLINEAYDKRLTRSELISMAKKIGADVPFFLGSSASICTGIGEKLRAVPAYSGVPILIIKPRQGVNTAQAYAQIDIRDMSQNNESHITDSSQMVLLDDSVEGVKRINQSKQLWSNDFQEFALEKLPILGQIQEFMDGSGAFYSALSGSGSAWFGCFEHKEQCQQAYDRAREIPAFESCFICKAQTLSDQIK